MMMSHRRREGGTACRSWAAKSWSGKTLSTGLGVRNCRLRRVEEMALLWMVMPGKAFGGGRAIGFEWWWPLYETGKSLIWVDDLAIVFYSTFAMNAVK